VLALVLSVVWAAALPLSELLRSDIV